MRRSRSRWKTVRGRLGWYVVREDSYGQFVAASGPHPTREEARRVQREWTGYDNDISALYRGGTGEDSIGAYCPPATTDEPL